MIFSKMLRFSFWISIVFALSVRSAWPDHQPAVDPQADSDQSEASYPLAPGDILEVSVWKEEGLEKEVIVPPDGVISFPLAGSFKAEGKTIDQIRDELESRLGQIIVDPIITVFLRSYASHRIYVIGKVNQPGVLPIAGSVDVMQALAMAGGMAQFADKDNIKILRRVDGTLTAIPFNYSDVADGEALDQNIILHKGDVIVVH